MEYLIYLVYIAVAFIILYRCEREKLNFNIESEYLDRLNSLRGVFALDIIIGHVAGHGMIPLMPFEKFSIVSVFGFFFLSGSGMTYSCYNKENYLNRIFGKIIYLIAVTMITYIVKIFVQLVSGLDLGYIPTKITDLPQKYFEITNWYIWELIVLYIFFFLIYKGFTSKKIRTCLIVLASVVLGIVFALSGTVVAWYYSIWGFAFGVIFTEFFEKVIDFIHKWYGIIVIVSFIFAGFGGYALLSENAVMSYITRNFFDIACLMILILLIEQIRFENGIIRFLTTYSLEIYLYQSLWLDVTQSFYHLYCLRMIVVVGLTIFTAILIRPINEKIKKLLKYKKYM
mgnify:CR=1 FL=1